MDKRNKKAPGSPEAAPGPVEVKTAEVQPEANKTLQLDELEGVDLLLEEIEDKIAPLAL